MSTHWAGRAARRLARWTGDQGRADEVRSHLDEAEAAGHPARVGDVVSVSSLIVRRAARDLPWWLAGLPIPVLFIGIFAMAYETHFHAWDVVGRDEFARTSSTVIWMRVIESAALVGVVAAVVAGRRVVQQLRQGSLLPPALFATTIVVAFNQIDLFVERTAWWRDGGLKAEHVNDVSLHSVALFVGFALLPIGYLIAAHFNDGDRPQPLDVDDPITLDAVAVFATALPLTAFFFGPPALLLTMICVWLSPSFTRPLKWAATGVVGAPTATAAVWSATVRPIDDVHPAVIGCVLLAFAATRFRMAIATVQPLRDGHATRRPEPA